MDFLNEFKLIKNQLDTREVVQKYLGEPDIKSGDTWKWKSPFRATERTASLCANSKEIKDFGGDFYGDIFNFVVELKGISLLEALELIAKDFNIELPNHKKLTPFTNFTQNNNSNNSNSVKKIYTLEATDEKVEEIYCMFDTVAYPQKPQKEEIGRIKNRIPTLQPYAYTIDKIKSEIISGKTCIPSAIKSQNDWKDDVNFLQIFLVDIDNVKTVNGVKENITVDDERHVTVEKIVKYCESINLLPTFIYYTFSHTERQHKFRLVYVLNLGTQKQDVVKGVYDFLKEAFKNYNIDTAPTNISNLFFGGQAIAYASDIYYKVVEKEVACQVYLPAVEIVDNYELSTIFKALERNSICHQQRTSVYCKKRQFSSD